MPSGSAEASIVTFLFSKIWLLPKEMVWPDSPAGNVMVALVAALATTARREPAPEAAVLLTTCARARGAASRRVVMRARAKAE